MNRMSILAALQKGLPSNCEPAHRRPSTDRGSTGVKCLDCIIILEAV